MKPQYGCNADRKTIAIVGFSVRAAAQCAHQQGYDVVAVDMCGDRDLLSECRIHIKLDSNWPAILNDQFEGVPLLLAGGMENRRDGLEQCQRIVRRPGPTSDQIASMRQLKNWEKWAIASELGWPTTVSNREEAKSLSQSKTESRWLLKSMASAGGAGTIELTDGELANESSFLEHESSYIQKWVQGESIGITFLSCEFGTTVVGATQAWQNERDFTADKYTYRGSYGPIVLPEELVLKLQRFGNLAARESQLLGLWQADFIRNDNQLFLLEINPRWSASMDLLDSAREMALVDLHYACICSLMMRERFDQFSLECIQGLYQQPVLMFGKWIVYADQKLIVTDQLSSEWWENRWDIVSNRNSHDATKHYFADIPCTGTEIAKGDPILTLMAAGKTRNAIWHSLQIAKSRLLIG